MTMSSFRWFDIIFLIISFIFCNAFVSPWELHNGVEVKKISAYDWPSARNACQQDGGMIATPVSADLINGIIAVTGPSYPGYYWSGFKKVAVSSLQNEFYTTESTSVKWRMGYDYSDTGDCVAMEVLLVGIRFYSVNCSQILDVVCYKPNVADIFTTNPHYINTTQTLTALDELDNTTAQSCSVFCLSRSNCKGYGYSEETSTCLIFSGDNLNYITEMENTTSNLAVNNTCEMINTTEVVNGTNASTCDIIPWYSYDLKFRKGCIPLDISEGNTSINNSVNYNCEYLYTPSSGQIHCGEDFRWNSLPYCTIKGPSCPEDWEEYKGYCYQVDSVPKSWREGIDHCAVYNAFPLYIVSEEEMLYLDKLLYIYNNATFWTGGANKEHSMWYRWTQKYSAMSYTRWENWKRGGWGSQNCVTLQKSQTTDEYYYKATDCQQKHPVICKMGRIPIGEKYCLDSTWCRGNGYCNTYGYNPYCTCISRQMIGTSKDNMTYCGYEWINVNNVNFKVLGEKLPWHLAAEVCKIERGSLLTMVTKDVETALKTKLWTSGSSRNYWTGLRMAKNGDYLTTGDSEYDLIETDYLPWRKQPIYKVNDTETNCIYMKVVALGIRLYSTTWCGSFLNSVCIQPDYGRFAPSDNSLLTPFTSLSEIISTDDCYLECFYDSDCISFTYNISSESCDLFSQASTGTNGDPYIVDRTWSGCAPLSSIWNGYFTSSTAELGVGSTVSYSCDEGYQIVSPFTSEVTCGTNGRWNQLPTCVRNPPRCPTGWEQDGVLCYYLSRNDITWASAKSTCERMDSDLVNIYNDEEMDFLTKLLDEDSSKSYWTGGNDILTDYWYTWTPDSFNYIPYSKWFPGFSNASFIESDDGSNNTFREPSSGEYEDCISLKRTYSKKGIDVGEVYFADEVCSRTKRFVCKQSVMNIGEMNCTRFPPNPCKTNSSCVNDSCTCNPGYLQIGLDNQNTTECSLILPIGSPYSCKGLDDLCVNNSICVNKKCSCPIGYYVNGIADSYATTCEIGELPQCPSQWTFHNNKCYKLISFITSPILTRPSMTCGLQMSHPAIIRTFEDNQFILSLGNKINTIKLMGLMTLEEKGLIWLDYSNPDYTNFYAATTTSSNGTGVEYGYINPIGYWEFSSLNILKTGQLTAYTLMQLLAVCERPTVCPLLPYVDYASYYNTTYDLGHTYTYKCEDGYIFGSDIDGDVICQHSTGLWSDIPVCVSLFDTMFNDPEPSVLYGILIEESTAFSNSCASACHDSKLCEAFAFNLDTMACKLYSNVTENFYVSMEMLPHQQSDKVWRKQECGVPPKVKYAKKRSTGRSFGSTVTYTCGMSYRLKKGMTDTLTCQENGHWYPEAPICLSRFKASKAVAEYGLPLKRTYEAAFTNDECRDLCIEEKTFRCVLSNFVDGVCFLFDRFLSDVGRFSKVYDTHSFAFVSELIDSDLEEFDLYYRQLVNITTLSVLDVSLELCAYQCLALGNCTGFSYFFESSIGVEYAICNLYDIPDILQNATADVNSKLYIPKSGCEPLPVISNLVFDTTLQQIPDKYSFGDKFTARCINFGEELVNGHSGEIECLKTTKWSRLPVCKNLCEVGWYMLNKTCYKLFEVPLPFWEAFDNCHAQNSGLVNLNSDQEVENLISVWNYTTELNNGSMWIGLFWDVWSWKWSENLGMDISPSYSLLDLPLNMAGHAMILNIQNNITESSTQLTDVPHQYFCEKAAGNLACPVGWRNYLGNCVKLFSDVKLSFKDAKTSCEAINSNLISMHSIYDKDILAWLVSQSGESMVYVGLYKVKGGQYHWVDGSRLDYYFYTTQEAEPADVVCGIATGSGVNYGYRTNCDTPRAYICQIPIDTFGEAKNFTHLPCSTDEYCADNRFHCAGFNINGVFYPPECRPKNCPPPWRFLDDRCYKFDTNKKLAFVDALDTCNRDGGYLASPLNVWNHHHMYFHYYDRYWIGAMDNIDVYGEIKTSWIKYQKKVGYSFFGPKSIYDFCVFVYPTFSAVGWSGVTPCTFLDKFLCEKKPVVDVTTPQYEGCFKEVSTITSKDLMEEIWTDSAVMTVDLCVDHCLAKGYKYAGIMNGGICSCGNSRGKFGLFPETNCGTNCPGNSAQICGGTGHNSVYRTSGNACSATMLRSPFDPSVCYSMVLNKTRQTWANLGCIQQGGSLVKFDNFVVEDVLYNQMLLGSLQFGISVGNTYMWMGLHYKDYNSQESLSWNDGIAADWTRFGNSNFGSVDKCVVTDIAQEGAWKKYQCRHVWNQDPKAFYICQFNDSITSKITGQNIQRTYFNKELHQSVKEGSWKVTGYLDNKCINNPFLCPEGFTITFWLQVPSQISSSLVLSTGNCDSMLIKSSGFCVFYSDSLLTLYDARFETVQMAQTNLQTDAWTRIILYFESKDIFLFIDGDFITSLNSSYHQRNTTSIIFDDLVIETNSGVMVENLTFVAAPPDYALLKNISYKNQEGSSEKLKTSFQLWGVNLSDWSSMGVDGNGVKLSHKSLTWATGVIGSAGDSNGFTVALWVKIPYSLHGNMQIFGYGGNSDYSKMGMWIEYNQKTNFLEILSLNLTRRYISTLSIETGKWIHIAVTLDDVSMKIYKHGSYVLEVIPDVVTIPVPITASFSITTAPPTTTPVVMTTEFNMTGYNMTDYNSTFNYTDIFEEGYNVTNITETVIIVSNGTESVDNNDIYTFLGTVICPPGWVQFRLSCYRLINKFAKFWDQEQHCQTFGGHMITIEGSDELNFIQSYLSKVGPYPIYLGVYDDLPYISTYITRRWMTVHGHLQEFNYFTDSFLRSKGGGYNYLTVVCDPVCNFDVNVNEDRNLVLCEINHQSTKSRVENSERCPSGWSFYDNNCYKVMNVVVSATDAAIECTKQRAVLAEIKSIEQQRFIANKIMSIGPTSAYIGIHLMSTRNGNYSYASGDLRPADFTYWSTQPLYSMMSPCVIMNCVDVTCHWQEVGCTTTHDAICQKPAETGCAPGWRLFKNRCVAVYEGADAEQKCKMSNTDPLNLASKAELEEYLYFFPIIDTTVSCLTDGVVSPTGDYIWQSTGELTFMYYSGQILSGTGQCISMMSTGLQLTSCTSRNCSICQYYLTGGIGVDNVYIKEDKVTDASVANLVTNIAPKTEYIGFNLDSISGTSLESYDNETSIIFNATEFMKVNLTYPYIIYPLNNSADSCLSNLGSCHQGITIQMWIYLVNISQCMIVDTMSQGNTGIQLWIESETELHVSITELNYYWHTWMEIISQEWIYLTVTWQQNSGLSIYSNFKHIHTEKVRRRTWPFTMHVILSSAIQIGICENTSDTQSLLLEGVVIRNEAIDDWVLAHDQITVDKRSFLIDFNKPEETSNTNMNIKMDDLIVSSFWRNSLFHTAINIDNPNGLSTAIAFNQTMHCFTQTDLCQVPFTISLWLQPRSMETDQIFLSAGTKTSSNLISPSYKLWYNTNTDNYFLELYYDKTHFTVTFYLILYKWYHIVINADLPNSDLKMFVNGQHERNMTSALIMERIIPRQIISFLEIGGQGQFYFDDLRFEPKEMNVEDIYKLPSCRDYKLAGFSGSQNLSVYAGDGGSQSETCQLDIEVSPYLLPLDINNMTSSLDVDFWDTSSFRHVSGVHSEAIELQYTGFNISNMTELCFRDIKDCFFGLTVALWVKIMAVNPNSDYVVLYEFGGNINTNQSGILMDCNQSDKNSTNLDCQIGIRNHTKMWRLTFSLSLNRWFHLAVTWNSFRTLTLYINGHSTTELGVYPDVLDFESSDISVVDSVFVVSGSSHRTDTSGLLIVDEFLLLERDVEDSEIKEFYGKTHRCANLSWDYNSNTQLCYSCKFSSMKNYVNAEIDCQSYGGNLVHIPDYTTYSWLKNKYDGILPSNSDVYTALKQMPRNGHPIRWPDGSYIQFSNNDLQYSNLNPRFCGLIPIYSPVSVDFCVKRCSLLRGYICQTQPMYTMAETIHFAINSSMLFNSTKDGYVTIGNISYTRGITSSSLIFNNSAIWKSFKDTCLINVEYCHNGVAIKFWLYLLDTLENSSREIIMSSMSGPKSYGLYSYIYSSGGTFMLGIDLRTTKNFTSMLIPVSALAWTQVTISISNTTDVAIYLNGFKTSDYVTVTYNETDVASRNLGELADYVVGSDWTQTASSNFVLDNLYVKEIMVTDQPVLFEEVSPYFQDFVLTMDETSELNISSTIIHSDGWLGNGIFVDSALYPGKVTYKGQLAFDCLGAPEYCVDGLTTSVWIYPVQNTGYCAFLSTFNSRSGFMFHATADAQYGFSLYNYTGISTGNLMLYQFPLRDYVWSNIIGSWYKNGTANIMINGIHDEILSTSSYTPGNVPSAPVNKIEINHMSSASQNPASCNGGVDEFMFYQRPMEENDLFGLYKNMTYVKHQHYWSLDTDCAMNASEQNVPMATDGIVGNACTIEADVTYVNLSTSSNLSSSCLKDIDNCVHGFTLNLLLKFLKEGDTDQMILSTGGHDPDGLGLAFMYTARNKSLPFRRYFEVSVLTSNDEYKAWFNLQWGVWSQISVTWHKRFGLKVFVDKILAWHNVTGATRVILPVSVQQNLMIGRKPDVGDPIYRGLFSVDELHFWDRASFEDTNLMKDNVFKHIVHTSVDTAEITTQKEVTREECQSSCIDSSCQKFVFCNANRFGTCNIISDNATSAAIVDSPDCDLFQPLSVHLPVQTVGCLNSTCINQFNVINVNDTSIGSCITECQQFQYQYFIVNSGLCHCGQHDLVEQCITYFNNSASSNMSCGENELLVYQITGLRDFLNVTVPIETFTVDLSPGNEVEVDQVIDLNFTVTEMSYAGYSLDYGNGSSIVYTGYNTTTVVYSEPGKYTLDIYALNEISWKRNITNIYVFLMINGMSVSAREIVATQESFNTTVTVNGGSNVTCEIDYGDGTIDAIFKSNVTEPYIFTRAYSMEDNYIIIVTCSNSISSVFNQTKVRSVNPIQNLSIISPDVMVFGEILNVSWIADLGTNVSIEMTLDGELIYNFTNWLNLSASETVQIPLTIYKTTGLHLLNMTAENIVSGLVSSSKYLNIDREIVSVELNFNKSHVKVNESSQFQVILNNGSNVNISVYWANLSLIDDFIMGDVLSEICLTDIFNITHVPGEYNIVATAENLVSNQNFSYTLYVEAVVDSLSMNITETNHPFIIDVTIVTQYGYLDPTNALYSFDFGDGTLINNISLEQTGGILTVSQNYSAIGFYDIWFTVFNNVSYLLLNNTVQIGDHIANLSVIATKRYIPLGDPVTVQITKDTGSFVSYALDFNDGTNISYFQEDNFSPQELVFNYTYANVGIYHIKVFAENVFNNMIAMTTVYVREKISGILLSGDTVGRVNQSLYFNLQIFQVGTNSCFLFDFKDGTFDLYGDIACQLRPEFNGLDFTELTGDSITLYHTYQTEGDYIVTVNSSNYVSYFVNTLDVKVLEAPCADPFVDISGFSKNMTMPTHIYLTTRMVIPSKANTFCLPPENVTFEWCVVPVHQNDPLICSYPHLSSLSIDPYTLSYGLYEVNVTISVMSYPDLTASSKVYIKVVPSPLVLDLIGDERCTSPSSQDLVVNASMSYDPDFPNDNDFNITFYCGSADLSLINAEDLDTSLLAQVGTNNCFSDIFTGDENFKSLIIPSNKLEIGMNLTFVVEMSKWNRTRTRTRIQRVEITTADVQKLAIRCKINCKNHVSASLPYKAVADCQTCVRQENYIIPYWWRLYEINGETYTEIQNFQSWTKTRLNSPSLAIEENRLTPGKDYAIRLESDQAYTVKIIHVTQPPYRGECQSSSPVGMAFYTVFSFSCDDWLDEGFRSGRDLVLDSSYLEDFTYTFYYKTVGRNDREIPFFKTYGRNVKTPGIIFGPGEEDNDNLIEITVRIKDRISCSAEYSFLIQVYNTSRTSDSVIKSLEMNSSRAEMDITVVNILCYSAIDKSNLLLSQNAAAFNTDYDRQIRMKVVDILNSQTDLIQDDVHLSSVTNIMGKVITNTDNVPLSGKEKIVLMFKKLIELSNSLLDSEDAILLRNKISRDLLSNIIEYCQRTKYLLGCEGDSCAEKFKVGEIAVDLIPFVNNLTSLLLKGAVPEEEAQIMEITQGNTKYFVQRKYTYNIRNNWISVQGQNVTYIPESKNMLDPYQISTVDQEVMISDNLFTTDKSVQVVKSRTISISLLDTDQGLPYAITDLKHPVEIDFYPQQANRLTFSQVNLVPKTNAQMFYIKIEMNETGVIPVIVIRPKVELLNLTCYIRTNAVPDNKTFDDRIMIDNWGRSNNTNVSDIIIKLDQLGQMAVNDSVYVGLVPELENPLDEPLVDLAVYLLGCSYWHTSNKHWSSDGLSIGNMRKKKQVPCQSSHLTTFSVNMFVPPNTIDFTTVWAKFENLEDNIVVFTCVIAVIVLYLICLIFVRRADKRDIKKWAVYPLKDNVSSDVYHYQMTVYTGMRKNAGTESKVFFVIGGEDGDTEIRELMDTSDRPLSTGTVNNYLLSVPYPLGNLTFLRIWHDNSGKLSAADWYLNMIIVKDIQTNYRYMFICDHWLALDKEDGEIERLVPVAGSEELEQFGHMFYMKTRQDVTDGHLWVSVFSRPTRSTFTRVQRLSCCLSLLFTTMITNAMWYKTTDNNQNQQNVHLGPFVFSAQEFFTSLMGSLIVIPVNLLIITFFKKSRPSKIDKDDKYMEVDKKYKSDVSKSESVKIDSSRCLTPSSIKGITFPSSATSMTDFNQMNSQDFTNERSKTKSAEKGKRSKIRNSSYIFPHWCVYIAWLLVAVSVIVSGLFVILYSLEWGYEKACQWFTSFMLSFVESVFLIQPLKVIAVAIVLILIFKKSDSSSEDCSEVFILDDSTNKNQSYVDDIYPAHRKPYLHSPPDPEKIEIARDYRKKMNKLFNITREMMAYLVYLVVVAILTYENRDTNSIYLHSNMENIFVKSQGKYHKSFENVNSKALFWSWVNTTVLPALYSEQQTDNNNQSDPSDFQNFLSDNIHYKIGLPRLRQARVEDDGCKVSKKMSSVIPYCYPEYSTRSYEAKNYSSHWNPYISDSDEAWIYRTTFDLKGLPVVGQYGSYSGGGYVMHLGQSIENATQAMEYLVENLWIDRKTRAVFVEFNVFNPNINLFSIVQLLAEFPATGGVHPYPQIISLRLYRYHGESAIFVLILDLIFVAFTLYYIVGLLRQIKAEKCSFITRFWNVIELLKVSLSIIACAFYGMQVIMIRLTLDDLHVNRDSFVNFQHVVLWDQLFGYIIAFLLFFAMLKVLLLLRFNSKITQLAGTLKKALSPLSSFFILFLFTIFAFAAFGHLVFGRSSKEYVSLIDTLETLMSMLMMKMNIDSLITVNDVLGSLYLFLFVLIIVFIQVNILISIINEVFTQVRQDPACLPDDPKMVDFILEQFKRVIFGSSDNSRGSGISRRQPAEDKEFDFKFDKTHAKLLMFIDQFYRDKN